MQRGELLCQKVTIMTQGTDSVDSNMPKKSEKESIHSGHFMVSDFNAEAQDDEYEVAVPVPAQAVTESTFTVNSKKEETTQQLSIETSLNKLFQCMSLAYRQKLTSPKWNRFKGIRLRWKDKIRLNNVIWRCWHMQFIMKQNTLVCQFASPLDVDTHNKPEAVVLEGKYWKRKLAAVTAEYKKWRMFYRNRIMGWTLKDGADMLTDMDMFDWQPASNESVMGSMMVDEDYMEFMSDTLFSTITANQPFAFPDTREIARGVSIADFIQPSLVQLQPNLDDFMDTLEPLQDLLCSKLPSVPEESVADSIFRPCPVNNYQGMLMIGDSSNSSQAQPPSLSNQRQQQQQQNLQYTATIFAQTEPRTNFRASTNISPSSEDYVQGNAAYQEVPMRSPGKNISTLNPGRVNRSGTNAIYQQPQTTSPFPNYIHSDVQTPAPRVPQHSYPTAPAPSQGYKFPLNNFRSFTPPSPQGFKGFRLPSPPSFTVDSNAASAISMAPPMKPPRSNSLPGPEEDMFALPKYNKLSKRNRSRSGPLHVPSSSSQRQHPPPLLSAASDPSLPTLNSLQPLLAQLLTNSTPVVYNFGASDKMGIPPGQQKSSPMVPILPMPARNQIPQQPATALLITNTVSGSQSPHLASRQLYHNPLTSTNKPSDSLSDHSAGPSPLSSPKPVDSPSSPSKPGCSKQDPEKSGSSRMRRAETPSIQENWRHIMAEQKRRCNIKNGFDMLHKLIPQLHQNPNAKLSKAAMLQKGADYIRQLQAERVQLRDEMDILRQQIEGLNTSISNCQSLLPATGAPISRQRASKMREMFDDYVRRRTLENWKFWIFSILFEPLLLSYNSAVSTASLDDLYRSTLMWTEQHCSLVDLRPAVLNSLRYLCTTTEILSDPSKLPEEARKAASKPNHRLSH